MPSTTMFLGWLAAASLAVAFAEPIPRITRQDGVHRLLVNDRPFLLLGAQVRNSSGWPRPLPDAVTGAGADEPVGNPQGSRRGSSVKKRYRCALAGSDGIVADRRET
jgi:hypothetical protein